MITANLAISAQCKLDGISVANTALAYASGGKK